MSNFEENILYVLKTKKGASEFINLIDILSNQIHSTNDFDIEKIISDTFGERKPVWSESLINVVNEKLSKGESLEDVRKLLNSFGDKIRKANIVKIEISFEPSFDFINKMYDILNNSEFGKQLGRGLDKNFLIDVDVNPSIKGGVKLFIEGKFIDLNLRNLVVDYLVSKDVINRYL